MSSSRIMIAGLASPLGGRLAQRLEEAGFRTIVGIDTDDPRHALERTEFVRAGEDQALLRRIIAAARIDTVIETRLSADALATASRGALEQRLDGTRRLLGAVAEAGGSVGKAVLLSCAEVYGSGREDPAFFVEEMAGGRRPGGALERALLEAEGLFEGLAAMIPGLTVTRLRAAPAVGPQVPGAHLALLGLPVVPGILGFDPRWQLIHEEDLVGALAHAVIHDMPGAYNAAADGVLALSEIASLLGKPFVPMLPPWGTVFAALQLRRLGLAVPVELVRDLRDGRGLDNRRLKAAGYRFRHTSREAILELRAHQRLRPLLGPGAETYRYDRQAEEFLRWSPSVQAPALDAQASGPGEPADRLGSPAASGSGYEQLTAEELLELIPSLEPDAIRLLREHEAASAGRAQVLAELDRQLDIRRV